MHKVVLTVLGGIGVMFVIALGCYLKLSVTSHQSPVSMDEGHQTVAQTDSNDSAEANIISLGRLLGCNRPAPPPVAFIVERPPGQADVPDLSTPSTAVYSVLSLIEQDATDKLVSCFVNDTEYPKSNLYPRYLGHPIELVEANEEGESAEVIWKATVHTEFSLDGKSGFPGDTITLRTSLVRAEDVWKILRLFDGVQDGFQ